MLKRAFLFCLIITAVLVGIWASISWCRSGLENRIRTGFKEYWQFSLSVDKFDWNVLSPQTIILRGVRVQTIDSTLEPLIDSEKVTLAINIKELLFGKVVIDAASLEQAKVFINSKRVSAWKENYHRLKADSFLKMRELECLDCVIQVETSFFGTAEVRDLKQANFKIMQQKGMQGLFNLTMSAIESRSNKGLFAVIFYQINEDRAEIKASYDDEIFMFEGVVLGALSPNPEIRGNLALSGRQIENFSLHEKMTLSGYLTGESIVALKGNSLQSWKETLSAQITWDIRDGAWRGVSLMRPTLGAVVSGNSKDNDLSDLLDDDVLRFDRLFLDIQLLDDDVMLNDVQVFDQNYVVEIQGMYERADKEMDLRGHVVVLEETSRRWSQRDASFLPFMNPHNRIVIPFIYRGIEPYVQVKADIDVSDIAFNQLTTSK